MVISHDSQLLSVVCDDEERAQVCSDPENAPWLCLLPAPSLHFSPCNTRRPHLDC